MGIKQSTLSKYTTHREAQMRVEDELKNRGYTVSLRPRNAGLFDLLAESPSRRTFMVDVRGQSKRNFWLIQDREPSSEVFYVLVYMPEAGGAPRFFILDCGEMMHLRKEYKAHIEAIGGSYKEKTSGVNWTDVYPFENQWETLPA